MEINGIKIQLVNSTEKNVNDYLEFVNSLSKDEDNYTLVRYSEVNKNQIIEWSKSWGKQTMMILAYQGDKDTLKVVGNIQLNKGRYFGSERQFHVGEIAYAVDKYFRGKGLIYALFSYLLRSTDVKILTAWVDERNIKSQKILENLGFERLCKINEFMYSLKEKTFVNLIFYSGRTEVARERVEKYLEKFNLKIKY
ncbi:GNAT family N-acetyltransferase [Acidianus brierleyi]|uniref:GNAT family N-acetyltransferase n=1 Tax=Acidianus brierleyi TaxID=41673 RepID=A0A2U9IJ60_9CREN|nr:GNAT family N-acetyltransferase [Acidianus brierleyi]